MGAWGHRSPLFLCMGKIQAQQDHVIGCLDLLNLQEIA